MNEINIWALVQLLDVKNLTCKSDIQATHESDTPFLWGSSRHTFNQNSTSPIRDSWVGRCARQVVAAWQKEISDRNGKALPSRDRVGRNVQ